jgi:hypothetical protein
MKNFFSYIALALLLITGGITSAFADPATQASATATKVQEAENTSTSTEKVEEKKDDYKLDSATTTATTTKQIIKKFKKISTEDRKTCDLLNDLDDNVESLASTSEIAQEKLTDIKSTLDKEIEKRDNFIASIKSIFSTKKKDINILTDAKTDVEDAQVFYKKLDGKLVVEQKYIDKATCEKVVRKELLAHHKGVDELAKSEDSFRKELTKKLKQSVKLLVPETKE